MTQRIGVKVEPAGTGSPTRFQNLPPLLTPLIGREQQEQAISSLLLKPEVRLLTLTGTAGIGKTRLAQKVAADLIEVFTHGVCLVQLAPISDSDLVVPTIAQTLGLRDVEERCPIRFTYQHMRSFCTTRQSPFSFSVRRWCSPILSFLRTTRLL